MFDAFGQMWGTMIVNVMTALCTLTGIMGVCIKEKLAIIVVRNSADEWLSLSVNLCVCVCVHVCACVCVRSARVCMVAI